MASSNLYLSNSYPLRPRSNFATSCHDFPSQKQCLLALNSHSSVPCVLISFVNVSPSFKSARSVSFLFFSPSEYMPYVNNNKNNTVFIVKQNERSAENVILITTGVGNATACVLHEVIYVIGGHCGYRGSCTYDKVQSYNSDINEWSLITSSPHPGNTILSVVHVVVPLISIRDG